LNDRVEFKCQDGLDTIAKYATEPGVVFFVDPPYTAGSGKRAGARLYKHNELDHERLFQLMSECRGEFVMTYDDDREVLALVRRFRFNVERIPMKNTHHEQKSELVITKA
jgi:DNA adenine methylase